jgi:hypothetical protein
MARFGTFAAHFQEETMPENKGLNRGGKESEPNDGRWREPTEANLDRDQEKQKGGISREPSLNPNSQRQERHISD